MGEHPQSGRANAGVPPRKSKAYGRQWQQKRRADPTKRAAEQAAQRAQKAAWKRLAKTHPDEYLTMLNEARFKEGLGPAQTHRGRSPRPVTATVADVDADKQRKCPHNQGLKRFDWGKVCEMCGKRIT